MNVITQRRLRSVALWLSGILLGIAIGIFEFAVAQDKPSSDGAVPSRSGGVTSVQTQSNILEYGLVFVLFGGALFAVCRSSRRN